MPSSLLLQLFPATLPSAWWLPLAAITSAGLDRLLGEPKRWHPLAGFGALATAIEHTLNRGRWLRLRGLLAWALIVLPWVALAAWLTQHTAGRWIADVLLLYWALGGRSLAEHSTRVAQDLASGNLLAARLHVGWMVSRDTVSLDASGVAKACVESTLENGNDAVFGALFWFALLGGSGALLFRLANTLDAMWGYKSERYLHFGWAAARIDDTLNFFPARLTALSYALFGRTRNALACWKHQAPLYHGRVEQRPPLGAGCPARGEGIARALALVRRSLVLWLALFLCWGIAHA